MLGNDMSWAAFSVIEVMSQDRFNLKRTGLLAAAQSFTSTTDVLLLCVQLLKKEFTAKTAWEIGCAINTLACIATEDLSRDLLGDVVQMLTSSRVYIKKKAALVLYKMYCAYPPGLRLTFDNLKRTLTDDNPSVVSCAVNVVAELARKKPSNYLSLAPEFFNLLTTSSSNWMLIKVIKLLASLVTEEPRLARKLLEPLANLIQSSGAKSVQYEAINCLTVALQHTKKADGTDAKNVPTVVRLCTDRLRELVRDPDQNLKYLGLVGLVGLMKSHPRVVAEHRELVLACLMDEDVTIRLRALELVSGMCTRRNLPDIVDSLFQHLDTAEGHWRSELIDKIIFMCSRDKYAYLNDFSWYVEVLSKLAGMEGGAHHAAIVAGQLLDVTVRVEDVRPTAMSKLIPMLNDANLIKNARVQQTGAAGSGMEDGSGRENNNQQASSAESAAGGFEGAGAILAAAAWIVGEFCSIIPASLHSGLLDDLLSPAVVTLPPQLQASYVQCLLKVIASSASAASKSGGTAVAAFLSSMALLLPRLNPLAQSCHVEVQERACLIQQLLATLGVSFTPLETPSALAAAKAKAEDDLLALAGAGEIVAPAAPTPTNAGSSSPSKAFQAATCKLPPLDPDVKLIASVLSSLFAEALKPVNSKAQKRVPVPAGLDLSAVITPGFEKSMEEKSPPINPAYVTFEDSYGLDDDEFAGTTGGGGGGKGKKSKKGGAYDVSGGDEEDDAWFNEMKKKNKKRDHELWGTGEDEEEEEKTTKKKGGKTASKSKKGDPFLLGNSRSRSATEDVGDIPIKTLTPGELSGMGRKPLLDASIFGDVGKGSGKSGKSGKKKGKGGEDDTPTSRTFRIISDEDFPKGAKNDDDDDMGGGMGKVADALSNIDLSTPLGDDEVLHAPKHRSVADPAALRGASKKGGGRARVLGSSDGGVTTKDSSEKGKKSSKTSSSAKSGTDSSEKKEKKEKKAPEGGGAAAPAAAKASGGKKEKKSAAPTPPDLSSAEPYQYPIVADKVLKVTFTASGAFPAQAGAAAGITLGLRVETKSSKKTIEWVDAVFSNPSEGLLLATSDTFSTGASPNGALRILGTIKPKEKGAPKAPAKRTTFSASFPTLPAPAATLSFTLTLSYRVEGSEKIVTLEPSNVSIPVTSLLCACSITPDDYKTLMTTSGATFEGCAGGVPFLSAGGLEESLTMAQGILRAFAVAKSPKHGIMYSKALSGEHVTVLLREDPEKASTGGGLALVVKSQLSLAHAEAILASVTSTFAAAIKAASKDKEDKE